MKKKYKVGDWVIHNYDICQVKKVEGLTVTEVSDGSFNTSGCDLTVRPLTLTSKVVAECYTRYREKIEAAVGPASRALNWPDIHRKLSASCMEAIDCFEKKNNTAGKKVYDETEKFIQELREAVTGSFRTGSGFQVYR